MSGEELTSEQKDIVLLRGQCDALEIGLAGVIQYLAGRDPDGFRDVLTDMRDQAQRIRDNPHMDEGDLRVVGAVNTLQNLDPGRAYR